MPPFVVLVCTTAVFLEKFSDFFDKIVPLHISTNVLDKMQDIKSQSPLAYRLIKK